MRAANRWTVLAVLSGALALISLDNTIVNVALPRLQQDLDATTAQLQWVVDAYSVMFAGTLLIAGSLGDRFGRRRMLVMGLAIFTVGSLSAVVAVNATQLTVCRALMGIGGACIMPSTLSVLVQVFPDRTERARAIGIWAAVAGLGVAIGPIIGGLLLEHFDWQAIFLVNPPIALGLLAAVLLLVPESRDPSRPRLDLIGAVLSALGGQPGRRGSCRALALAVSAPVAGDAELIDVEAEFTEGVGDLRVQHGVVVEGAA